MELGLLNICRIKINLEKATVHISENEINQVIGKIDAFIYHLPNNKGWFINKDSKDIPISAQDIRTLKNITQIHCHHD